MTTLYNIIKADTPEQLEVQVMEYLEKGWKPQGGMQVVAKCSYPSCGTDGQVIPNALWFFQAVVCKVSTECELFPQHPTSVKHTNHAYAIGKNPGEYHSGPFPTLDIAVSKVGEPGDYIFLLDPGRGVERTIYYWKGRNWLEVTSDPRR